MLIKAREYMGGWARRLFYPSEEFAICFYNMNKAIITTLEKDPSSKEFMQYFKIRNTYGRCRFYIFKMHNS
jgi:hypothetical protein